MQRARMADLIAEYVQLRKAGSADYRQEAYRAFSRRVQALQHEAAVEDILSYIEQNLVTKQWLFAHEWIGSALLHPSAAYIEPLLNILREEDSNAPHYWALDVMEYMPVPITQQALPGLRSLMEPVNPAWSEAVIEKYFETIVFNDEDDEAFIASFVNSPNDKIAFRAKYWMETFEVDRRETEED